MFETTQEKEKVDRPELIEEIKGLIETLNKASLAYYQEAREIMPNYEYDALYDRLRELENITGVIFSNSPTQNVGYEVLSELPKEAHPQKMLSLDKTKDVGALRSFVGDHEALMSWKLDGLTVVLTYRDGSLAKAVTRGNGEIGEVITNNARVFANVPLNIEFKGETVLRGEAVITYDEFERINASITDEGAKYKNPRNLCSGSVRQLDPAITKQRRVRFFAFSLVSAEGKDFVTRKEQFDWLAAQGFQVVEHKLITGDTVEETVKWFADNIAENPVPSDGLVVSLNDIEYGRSLGVTAKFPRDSIAFKWQDETAETTLREIEWSASRTGLINPVAIFDPVELEGTTVSRASVHNISVMKELKLGIGDRITVYKANMIIPQIAENLTGSSALEIPGTCPVCGGYTVIKSENGVETLNCPNPECPAKQIKGFAHFVSRDAMNVEGLSESTLEKLVDRGLIKDLADVFRVKDHHDEIVTMEGFGELSFKNLCDAVEKARKVTPQAFLYSLGIPNFGRANAGLVAKYCRNDWEKIRSLEEDELVTIEGIGDVMAKAYCDFFRDEKNIAVVDDLLTEVELDGSFEETGDKLAGMTFVITGSLETYPNRDALKDEIEANGGKVAGSVSAKTSYLINNDLTSNSGKNKKAKELGIPIISEADMVKWLKEDIKP
ncbi:MAG: NAD-dependent DNA ligase LigA [Clostridiales bacterium]|nr:NAD-dependent DNA ligase LigA [Clostridiales bacterium]